MATLCGMPVRPASLHSQLTRQHPHPHLHLPRCFQLSPKNCKIITPKAQHGGDMMTAEKVDSVKSPHALQLTYLEGNSWLWEVVGIRVLVDPVLVGNLDFGIPWLYSAAKKQLKEFKLEDLPELDLLLITQSLDDHCHKKTLKLLSKMMPDLLVISTPNAQPILSRFFKKAHYLEPGQGRNIQGVNGAEIAIHASAGPILGPPWQRPENGYFIKSMNPRFVLYYEPHCVYSSTLLKQEYADVIITPVIKQVLSVYTLVSGQEDAVELARLLQARCIVTMKNGDLESKGFLSKIISEVGSTEKFKEILFQTLPNTQVLEPVPGLPLQVPIFP